MAVPSGVGLKMDQANDRDGGMVSFHDDFGNLKAINYLRLPADAPAVLGDPARRDAAYRGFLHDYIVPNWFQPVSPNTSVDHEKFLTAGAEPAFFAVVDIPGASAMVDMKTGRRLDSRRAVLVFAKNDFMYMLSHELLTVFAMADKTTVDDKAFAGAVTALRDFKASIRFQ